VTQLAATQTDIPAPIGPHTIRRFTLSNGIRLIVQENHASPSVVLRGHVWAGSVSEPADRTGLADFTASAVRRGSTTRTYQVVNELIETVGASVFIGAGRRLTRFGGKALAEDLDLLVDVLGDLLLNPAFDPAELEKLRGQTITSLKELENNTRGLAEREFRQALFSPEHPYGRPVEGTLESVPQISRSDAQTFYAAHYRPEAACLVVVGDVAAERVGELLDSRLGGWRPAGDPSPPDLPPIPPLAEPRRAVRTLANKTQVDIVLGTLGPARAAPDLYAARVADTILGHLGLMGRLGERVRDQLGMAYYAYSTLEAGLEPGPWSVSAGVAPESVAGAVEAILAEIARLRDEPVTDAELEDAQDYLTGVLPLRLETNEGIAGTLLDMELYQLGDDYIMRYPGIIRGVTKTDVQTAVHKYLDPARYALAIAGPWTE
jgi:zinc protease